MTEVSRREKERELIRAISAGGILLALSEILSLFKLFTMPQGGSVTPAAMLPIIFYALCFGPVWGFGAALIFSFLQMAIGGYVIGPVQAVLDYTLAFGFIGAAGFFSNKKAIRIKNSNILGRLRNIPFWKIAAAVMLASFGRLFFSTISGVVFFKDYAPEGQSPFLYSIGYNGSYLLVEAAITVIVLFVLAGTMHLISRKNK